MSVGVGVIGTGAMGSEHARLLIRGAPGGHLAGVFDADAARARIAAAGATVYSDPKSLIASDRVGAVIIASPDATHAELALACLEAWQACPVREAAGFDRNRFVTRSSCDEIRPAADSE